MKAMKAMRTDEALDLADEWIKNITVYEGALGWRVVCHTLATEVRRLRNALTVARAAHVLRTWDDEALAVIDEALNHE